MSQQQHNNTVELEENSKKKQITQEELEALKSDPKVRVKETGPGQFKKLDRMHG